MRCDLALERMLEAAPAELRGADDSPLARHIASCDRCSRMAAVLLEELGPLDETMRRYGEAGDARASADAALAAVRGDPTAHGVTDLPERHSGRRRHWPRAAWIPLAAAAALAGLLLVGRENAPIRDPTGVQARMAPPAVAVQPPRDRHVAILETANPKITIVWLYQKEGT